MSQEVSFNTLQYINACVSVYHPPRPATHFYSLWCCGCPWTGVISYHQAIRLLVCPYYKKKKAITKIHLKLETFFVGIRLKSTYFRYFTGVGLVSEGP